VFFNYIFPCGKIGGALIVRAVNAVPTKCGIRQNVLDKSKKPFKKNIVLTKSKAKNKKAKQTKH